MIVCPEVQNRITIAGGGLAGLSLGIALRLRGVEVEIHEALTYPRHRVCGEFLSGVESPTLARLGIDECLSDAEKLESAIWSDTSGELGTLKVRGLGMSRWRLDDRLQKKFRDLGGTLVTQSRIPAAEGVVWCAGRPRRESPWIGLKCHARAQSRRFRKRMAASSAMHWILTTRPGHRVVTTLARHSRIPFETLLHTVR